MSKKYINADNLSISEDLYKFINNEVIPGTNINSEKFWKKFSSEVHELSPINKSLIQKRESIQKKIDDWHKSNQGKDLNKIEYTNFFVMFKQEIIIIFTCTTWIYKYFLF